MSEVTLSKEAMGLEECEVGETYNLTGTVTAVDGDNVTISVESAEYAEPEEAPAAPKKSPVAAIASPMKKNYG